jgi:hypothetical protein
MLSLVNNSYQSLLQSYVVAGVILFKFPQEVGYHQIASLYCFQPFHLVIVIVKILLNFPYEKKYFAYFC